MKYLKTEPRHTVGVSDVHPNEVQIVTGKQKAKVGFSPASATSEYPTEN